MAISSFPPAEGGGGAGGFYYYITELGTQTVDLPAGLYDVRSNAAVTVEGVAVDGDTGLINYPSGVSSLKPAALYNLDDWTSRNADFGSELIQGLTHGDGLFVAGGGGWDGSKDVAVLTTSPDGITWTERTSAFGDNDIHGVAYGDGVYVAVGETGDMSTSPDGTTWTSRTSGFGSTHIYAVTHGDGVFVAGGYSGDMTTNANLPVTTSLSLEPKSPLIELP